MTRLKLPLLVLAWLISIASAFHIGQKKTSELEAQISSREAKSELNAGNALETASNRSVTSEDTESVFGLDASEPGEITRTFDLSDTGQLSAEEARTLLGTAFAMPQSDPSRSQVINSLLLQLAEESPLEALQFASEIGSLRDAERAKTGILQLWAEKDPVAALNWADTALANEPTSSRRTQLRAIFRGYAVNNPEAAFQAANALDDSTASNSRLKTGILQNVIRSQIESGGLLTAKTTVEGLEDSQTKSRLMRSLVDEWASFDPQSAASYVLSLGEDAGTNMKTALLSEWAENDPQAAAAWLKNLPPDDPAIAASSAEIIREWTRYDLNASAEWLNSLPQSPDLDRAVANYTFRAAREDPETAMSWAESISSDEMRTRSMRRVASTWNSTDAETFEGYLADSSFNEEQKEVLRTAGQNRGENRGDGERRRFREQRNRDR